MATLFAAAIFLSAALLFWLELMVAKMVLPKFGGGPAVWNTCVLFFQALLLLGYGYAHLLPSRLGVRRQVLVHAAVILLPLAVLPVVVPARWDLQSEIHPIAALLGYLSVAAGLPLFVVCTTTPLLQRWFASTGHRHARDPYFLYAASNAGSFAGLLGYPTLLEPNVGLRGQGWLWEAGYLLLLLLLAGCAVVLWRSHSAVEVSEQPKLSGTAPTPLLRTYWVALAFVPSSLMLGVTVYFTSEIAPVPLLWVIPLAVYLLTFIVAFGKLPGLLLRAAMFALPLLVVWIAWVMTDTSIEAEKIYGAMKRLIPLHLAALFVAGVVLHGRLARARPDVPYLTEYFFWISLGGVLGGMFNGLVAPLAFSGTAEYPLTLVLAALLAPPWWELRKRPTMRWLDWGATVPLGLVAAGIFVAYGGKPAPGQRVLHRERNFFGIVTVTTDEEGRFNYFYHGKTNHGAQNVGDPRFRRLPLLYFYHSGPIGQALLSFRGKGTKKHVGIIGLGVGSLAAYGEKGQEITYYEIDPAVERVARSYFTYLEDSEAHCRVVLGDGRQSLEREPDGYFDILIFDAFSSDAVPIHLITEEALHLYLDKLAPNGLLILNISNNYLDLEPVVAALARACKLKALVQLDTRITPGEAKLGKTSSHWVLLARDGRSFGKLGEDPRWKPLRQRKDVLPWTDDYSNLFRVLNWN